MKNRIIVSALALAVVLGGGIFASAMAEPDLARLGGKHMRSGDCNFGGPGIDRGDRLEHKLEMMAAFLDLTDEQKAKVKGIVDAEMEKNNALREAMRADRQKLRDMLIEPEFDEAKVRELAARQADQRIDLMIARAKVKNRVLAELNEEQQEKARTIMEFMGQRRHMRGMKHH